MGWSEIKAKVRHLEKHSGNPASTFMIIENGNREAALVDFLRTNHRPFDEKRDVAFDLVLVNPTYPCDWPKPEPAPEAERTDRIPIVDYEVSPDGWTVKPPPLEEPKDERPAVSGQPQLTLIRGGKVTVVDKDHPDPDLRKKKPLSETDAFWNNVKRWY